MAAAEIEELCAKLRLLWEESGEPGQSSLGQRCGRSKSQISAILTGKVAKAPAWDVVRKLVEGCFELAKGAPSLTADLAYWRTLHGQAEAALRPAAPPTAATDWTDLVRVHPAWNGVADASKALGNAMTAAEQLFAAHHRADRTLAGDPWRDPELPMRMTDQVSAMISLIGEHERLEFTPLEAAVLSLAPLAHQTRVAVTAAAAVRVDPTDLSIRGTEVRTSYERHLGGQEERRLVARAAQRGLSDRTAAPEEIGWWLFHRWIETQPTATTTISLDDPSTSESLVDILNRLTRLLRLSPGDLANPQRLGLLSRTTHLGVTVRERLLGMLLTVGHAFAVEPITLSPAVVEHLGVPNAVDLGRLRTTLTRLTWERVSIGRGMVARCDHEAVLQALRDHAARADAILNAVHAVAMDDAHLQPLLHLPTRTSADRVEPTVHDGHPAFAVPVTRFRLDEDRVRELLMGQQLYGDRSLAIRELYQNALDACRYRDARQRYLPGAGGWTGSITFDQGMDEQGRHYLSCTDNGIGMGAQELREVFSQAGVRFADRPEFLEEQAQWAERDIHLYPNSRFGIGVLSYFMLADEIEVTTCRMDRHGGRPGPEWHVRIVGPGHFFRITPGKEHGTQPGTTVTLYLRDGKDAPSCVEVLNRLLGIAEFATTATDTSATAEWEPYVFRRRMNLQGNGIHAAGELVHSTRQENGQVVWCGSGGALLADGLFVTKALTKIAGAVVNLTREWVPRLTVDRTQALGNVSDRVKTLITEAASELISTNPRFLSFDWISSIVLDSPDVADIVTEAAINSRLGLRSDWGNLDTATTGCLTADKTLVPPKKDLGHTTTRIPDWILLWRLIALRPHLLPESIDSGQTAILPALPSDATLIEYLHTDPAHFGNILEAANSLERNAKGVVERASTQGYRFANAENIPEDIETQSMDRNILGVSNYIERRDFNRTTPRGRILQSSRITGLSIKEVVQRLEHYAITIEEIDISEPWNDSDLVILSRDLDGQEPWLTGDTIRKTHVEKAAKKLGWSDSRATERLHALGYTIAAEERNIDAPSHAAESLEAIKKDFLAMAERLDSLPRQWKFANALSSSVELAHKQNLPLKEVLVWFRNQGIPIPDTLLPQGVPTLRDRTIFGYPRSCELLLSWKHAPRHLPYTLFEGHESHFWETVERLRELGIDLDVHFKPGGDSADSHLLEEFDQPAFHVPDKPIPIRQILGLALAHNLPVAEVAERLEAWELEVEPVEEAITRLMGRVPRAGG
ncbi:HD domain-containing protein [Actinokineospora globicatena]|uniref:HD domain-containing protein n=1 Tax=Actinokineospora globicatena TaxID=103729 RepID=UPI0020A50491|nr:hypothetical protein [Actinokineospora globicatena]MCP2302464.1 Histidine kinase-, DNA gyrase B-, and HSP90-like ATPase [Actinokineospora globicatena]GLW75853.1 hypothetical protein Aglo01_03350 [Actinokineospora globicatena]GLW82691.1 hypothetical protein Aglo02_03320 [Actinokineospora globicatena]